MIKVSLIITIVKKGWGGKVLEASMKAGAHGGTILIGRGIGIHEKQKILGIQIEPEKEIVLTADYSDDSQTILKEICQMCDLEKPGAGIAFVVPVEQIAGVAHLLGGSEA
jgi:nitrogen regulatory protein PII